MAQWRSELGDELPSVQPFLRPRSVRATSYPGPGGLPFDVIHHADGRIAAVGPDPEDRIELAETDLVVYELHVRKLAESFVEAFAIESIGGFELASPRLHRLGRATIAPANSFRCYVGFPDSAADVRSMTARLVEIGEVPFLLLVPTRRWLRLDHETIVRARGSSVVPLAESLDVSQIGTFGVRRPLAEIIRVEHGLRPGDGKLANPAVRYAIVKLKTKWRITFEGNETQLKDLLGIRYLAHLIEAKGRSIPCYQLHALAKGQPVYEPMPGIIKDEHSALAKLRTRILEIDAEMEEAKSLSDHALQIRLEDEKQAILEELRTSQGLKGQIRREKSKAETIRVSVYNRIQTTLLHLDDELPALADHLRSSIQGGSEPCYSPAPDIHWEVRF